MTPNVMTYSLLPGLEVALLIQGCIYSYGVCQSDLPHSVFNIKYQTENLISLTGSLNNMTLQHHAVVCMQQDTYCFSLTASPGWLRKAIVFALLIPSSVKLTSLEFVQRTHGLFFSRGGHMIAVNHSMQPPNCSWDLPEVNSRYHLNALFLISCPALPLSPCSSSFRGNMIKSSFG